MYNNKKCLADRREKFYQQEINSLCYNCGTELDHSASEDTVVVVIIDHNIEEEKFCEACASLYCDNYDSLN